MSDWLYDPTTGAYYDPDDTPIRLIANPPVQPSNNWLLWALALLILIAAKKK